jgi:hypothetical protein
MRVPVRTKILGEAMITQKERDERNKQSAFEAAVEAGVGAIYVAFPQVKPSIASRNMIIELCNRWAGQPVVPTPELLRAVLDENPEALRSLALEDIDAQRAALVDDICGLLRNPNEQNRQGAVRGGLYSPADLKTLRDNKLQWMSRDELIAYRDDIQRKQVMNLTPVTELKQVVRDSLPKRRADGYPQLPAEMVFAGEIQARKLDGALLRSLAESDYQHFKKLCRVYGANQISERMSGR